MRAARDGPPSQRTSRRAPWCSRRSSAPTPLMASPVRLVHRNAWVRASAARGTFDAVVARKADLLLPAIRARLGEYAAGEGLRPTTCYGRAVPLGYTPTPHSGRVVVTVATRVCAGHVVTDLSTAERRPPHRDTRKACSRRSASRAGREKSLRRRRRGRDGVRLSCGRTMQRTSLPMHPPGSAVGDRTRLRGAHGRDATGPP